MLGPRGCLWGGELRVLQLEKLTKTYGNYSCIYCVILIQTNLFNIWIPFIYFFLFFLFGWGFRWGDWVSCSVVAGDPPLCLFRSMVVLFWAGLREPLAWTDWVFLAWGVGLLRSSTRSAFSGCSVWITSLAPHESRHNFYWFFPCCCLFSIILLSVFSVFDWLTLTFFLSTIVTTLDNEINIMWVSGLLVPEG